MDLGKAIMLKRLEAKISQESLADIANTTQKHLSRLENNKTNATIKMLFNISSALGCKVSDIILLAESFEP